MHVDMIEAVASLLRPEESLRYLLEGKERSIGLVSHEHETAIVEIENCVPAITRIVLVSSGIQQKLSQLNDGTCLLEVGGISYVSTLDAVHGWIEEVKKAALAATERDSYLESSSHPWAYFYRPAVVFEVSPKVHAKSPGRTFTISPIVDASPKRKTWVDRELRSRRRTYSESTSIKLRACTWNVNGKPPLAEIGDMVNTEAEILAIGLQEADLSADSFLVTNETKLHSWHDAIFAKLEDYYDKVASHHLVGMMLFVYAHKSISPIIHDIKSTYCGCGIMGLMGNKGGVSISFQLYDSKITLVDSHLAARHPNVERRNSDFTELSRRLVFPDKTTIWDSDHLIWMGDLNYRLDLTHEEIRTKLETKSFDEMLRFDQLKHEQHAGRAFTDFHEAPINFTPSFKYVVGTTQYDTSEANRVPSWCDRILWKTDLALNCVRYDSLVDLCISDHKPVLADFSLEVLSVDKGKETAAQKSLIKELEQYEMECKPRASIDRDKIVFGSIEYLQSYVEVVELINTGHVNVKFVVKTASLGMKQWLWVQPCRGELKPGQGIRAQVAVVVDNNSVTALNSQNDAINEILEFQIEDGNSHYVSLAGTFNVTCFGQTLDFLSTVDSGVRKNITKPQEAGWSVPLELWHLVDYLHGHATKYEDLFSVRGNSDIMRFIRAYLDDGKDLNIIEGVVTTSTGGSDGTELALHLSRVAYAVADVLLSFLGSLADPVIPFALYEKSLKVEDRDSAISILDKLPRVNTNSLLYIVSFLKDFTNQHPNRLVSLLLVFSTLILRPPRGFEKVFGDLEKQREKRRRFLAFFVNEDV